MKLLRSYIALCAFALSVVSPLRAMLTLLENNQTNESVVYLNNPTERELGLVNQLIEDPETRSHISYYLAGSNDSFEANLADKGIDYALCDKRNPLVMSKTNELFVRTLLALEPYSHFDSDRLDYFIIPQEPTAVQASYGSLVYKSDFQEHSKRIESYVRNIWNNDDVVKRYVVFFEKESIKTRNLIDESNKKNCTIEQQLLDLFFQNCQDDSTETFRQLYPRLRLYSRDQFEKILLDLEKRLFSAQDLLVALPTIAAFNTKRRTTSRKIHIIHGEQKVRLRKHSAGSITTLDYLKDQGFEPRQITNVGSYLKEKHNPQPEPQPALKKQRPRGFFSRISSWFTKRTVFKGLIGGVALACTYFAGKHLWNMFK